MIPIQLSLHNFLSYLDTTTLDFSSFDLAVLSGENGVGKSSILEALTWAVWEKTRAASSDDLIHQGTQEMWVDFIFEHEGQIYRVFRRRDRRKGGVSTLEFQIKEKNKINLLNGGSWKTISESTLRTTQDKIISVLKLPYEIFTNSSYLRQGEADEFTVKTPAERKEILGEILGLSEWDDLEEKAKQKIKTVEAESQTLNFQIEDLKNQINQKSRLEKEFAVTQKLREKTQKQIKELEKRFRDIDSQKKKREILLEKINNLRERFEEKNTILKNLQVEKEKNKIQIKESDSIISQKDQINYAYRHWQDLTKKLTELEIKREKFQKLKEGLLVISLQEQELRTKIVEIKDISTCPTCLRPLKKLEAEKIIRRLEESFSKKYLPQKKAIEEKIGKIGFDDNIYRDIKKESQTLLDIESQKRELAVASKSIEVLETRNKKIEDEIKTNLKERHRIEIEGKRISQEAERLKSIEPQWQKVDAEIRIKREELLKLESDFGGLKQVLTDIRSDQKEYFAKETRLKRIAEVQGILQELAIAFGKKGVQAMIIEQAIPAIEEEANLILAKATSGKMRMQFITQKAKKAAEEELIETLEIRVADQEGARPYEMYSGGEAFRINFAIRVALSKFLASRSGIHLRFLAIDEGFGTLDTAGREDLAEAINSIREDFAKIIVITHIQELKDLFPTQILVTKDQKGSHLELI